VRNIKYRMPLWRTVANIWIRYRILFIYCTSSELLFKLALDTGSVAGLGCLSRTKILKIRFFLSGSRIQGSQDPRSGSTLKYFFLVFKNKIRDHPGSGIRGSKNHRNPDPQDCILETFYRYEFSWAAHPNFRIYLRDPDPYLAGGSKSVFGMKT
jgi:hypothetical protein